MRRKLLIFPFLFIFLQSYSSEREKMQFKLVENKDNRIRVRIVGLGNRKKKDITKEIIKNEIEKKEIIGLEKGKEMPIISGIKEQGTVSNIVTPITSPSILGEDLVNLVHDAVSSDYNYFKVVEAPERINEKLEETKLVEEKKEVVKVDIDTVKNIEKEKLVEEKKTVEEKKEKEVKPLEEVKPVKEKEKAEKPEKKKKDKKVEKIEKIEKIEKVEKVEEIKEIKMEEDFSDFVPEEEFLFENLDDFEEFKEREERINEEKDEKEDTKKGSIFKKLGKGIKGYTDDFIDYLNE